MITYTNGNGTINLASDGTRTITFEDTLKLDYPLNIDIRVSTKCSFGLNPKTGKAFCSFCHESATTDGKECDYEALQSKLYGLPKGIELAIGANNVTHGLKKFIVWCHGQGYIVNLTINQGHLRRDFDRLWELIENGLIKGLGISYRHELNFDVPNQLLDYENTVFHVICGIDSITDVLLLKDKGIKKVLVLGEKNFGFNFGKVDTSTQQHKEWRWWVPKLFDTFDVVAFDNLALEQLNLKRFFKEKDWNTFNQGEYSMYINAVDQVFAPSSRSSLITSWEDITVQEYFKQLELA